MKKIEIPTAQNIQVEYLLANVTERGVAYLFDMIVIGLYVGLISLLAFALPVSVRDGFAIALSFPVYLFYNFFFELFNQGQSPGKKIMGIRVVKVDGKLPGFKEYLIRFVFRMVDIYLTATTLAVLCIVGTLRAQRLGDYLADTTVVKVKGGRRFLLSNIVSSTQNQTQQIVYPQAIRLSEEEMLLVQESILRYKRYKNHSHQEVLNDVSVKIQEFLGLSVQIDALDFLEQITRDYVQLTR